ncbi:uncharacterized protein LOC131952627 [Physella acuta]|uniref:uncharacterized protein LOC131952627 n=1 Tax=Physella acuta TaxID=109671 RepID=UPI0027DE1699|nr:uncharacterized protein LOC131952627 [Physella acuta]
MKSKKKITERQKKTHLDSGNSSLFSPGSGCASKVKESVTAGRRYSNRIKNQQRSTPKTETTGLIDSAYDADGESTPNVSPAQGDIKDPYDVSMIEDVPFVKSNNLKKKSKKSTQKVDKNIQKNNRINKKDNAKETGMKTNSTSTPVLGSGETEKLKSKQPNTVSVTPEVTPILPVKPFECKTPSDDSYITPQIRRSARKRACEHTELANISLELNYTSQGDSGIALSPAIKKRCPETPNEDGTVSKHDQQKKPTTASQYKSNTDHTKSSSGISRPFMNKRNIFSPNSKLNIPEILEVDKPSKGKSLDNSCFGFDSLGSPKLSPPTKPIKKTKTKKTVKSSLSYRHVQNNFSDSSSKESSPIEDSDVMQENIPRNASSSPSLFSDDVFSGTSESLEVNRSINKTYKHRTKCRDIKPKSSLQVSKLDVWASNFNMEIEDIEKFDLNIE